MGNNQQQPSHNQPEHKQRQQPDQQQPGGQSNAGQPLVNDSDDGISRRNLLIGGAGVAAAGAGGWFFFFRGPSGAKKIADEYVNAVADNDWDAAEELYHESSPVVEEIEENDDIEGYKQYLEEDSQTNLDAFEEIDPSVEDHIEWSHYPSYDEEVADETNLGPDPDQAEEIMIISTTVDIDATAAAEEWDRLEFVSGDSTTDSFHITVVNDGREWLLWNVFRPV